MPIFDGYANIILFPQGLHRTEYLYFNLIHYTIRTFHAKRLVHAALGLIYIETILYVVARICRLESIHSILHLVHNGKDIVA